jgi:hypothetical protein
MGHKRKRPSFETPRKSAALRMTAVYEAIQDWGARHRTRSRPVTLPTLRIAT